VEGRTGVGAAASGCGEWCFGGGPVGAAVVVCQTSALATCHQTAAVPAGGDGGGATALAASAAVAATAFDRKAALVEEQLLQLRGPSLGNGG